MGNNELFMEAYYGKLPEFEEIEMLFDSIIKRARADGYDSNPNKYVETKKIEKIFAKVFRLKKMVLYWIPSNVKNAYTVTIQSILLFGESKDYIEKRTDRGFYDTSGRSVFTVYAYTGLLQKDINLSANELTAILLHEFGHNFDYSKYHMISFLVDCLLNPGYANSIENNKSIEDHNKIKDEYLKNTKKYWNKIYASKPERKRKDREYKRAMEKALRTGMFQKTIRFIASTLTLPFILIISLPVQLLSLDGKKGELFADSFATSYGYGSDLITGLEKLGDVSKIKVEHSKGLDIMRDLNNCMDEIFIGLLEIHGTTQERCKETIKKLEADIRSSDFPPELEEELHDELNKVKARYMELLTVSENGDDKILKSWRKICNVIFGGAPNIAKLFKPNRV